MCVYSSFVLSFRAIESVYREYCEQNSKAPPDFPDCHPSEDLVWTDSAVWAKVQTLILQ